MQKQFHLNMHNVILKKNRYLNSREDFTSLEQKNSLFNTEI